MSIDYFNDGSSPKVDKSNWFASITCLSGALNGSLGAYGVDIDQKTFRFKEKKGSQYLINPEILLADVIKVGFNALAVAQNACSPVGT